MIAINNLTYRFDNKTVLADISLALMDKQIYYLTGPMGSGKSLILNAIAKGEQVSHDYSELSFTYIGDHRLIFEDLSVEDNLYFYQRLFKITSEERSALLNYFDFEINVNKKVDELSEGNKQLLYLICLLMKKQVQIYLLDEPFVNLDVESTGKLANYLKKISKDAIVLYTSHTYNNPELYDHQIKIVDKRIEVR